jgi:hypothetical protein
MAASQPVSEMPCAAGAVYQVGSKVIVKDFGSKIRSKRVYQGILGTNDVAALQYAQDNITGRIYVGPGTYYWNALETLLLKQPTVAAGIDKTIWKTAPSLNDNARNIVEIISGVQLQNLTIDGNSSNNNKPWNVFAGTPFAQGIYPGSYLTNGEMGNVGNTKLLANGCYFSNIKIINTLRTNLVMGGYRNVAENMILGGSLMDHMVYFSGAYNCRVSGADIYGGFDAEAVVFGTEASTPATNCVAENLTFHDITMPCYFSITTATKLISARPLSGEGNTVRGVRAYLPDLTGYAQFSPEILHIQQHNFLVEDVKAYIVKGNAPYYLYARGPGATLPICEQTYRDVDIYLAIDNRGGAIYLCESVDLSNLEWDHVTLTNASTTAMRGLYLIATNNSNMVSIRNSRINVYSSGLVMLTGTAAGKTITFLVKDLVSNNPTYTMNGTILYKSGRILPGEIRTITGSIATLTQDSFNSLDNPFGQSVSLLSLDVYVSTGATATAPNIDCGIGSGATTDYTTLFDDLPGETIGFYRSTIATPGAQTVPQLWQSGAGNRYLNMSIKDAAATGMVATYVATVMGI